MTDGHSFAKIGTSSVVGTHCCATVGNEIIVEIRSQNTVEF
jgi:hypothetical protein